MPAPSYHAQPDAASRVRLHVLEGTGPAHVPEGRGPPPQMLPRWVGSRAYSVVSDAARGVWEGKSLWWKHSTFFSVFRCVLTHVSRILCF